MLFTKKINEYKVENESNADRYENRPVINAITPPDDQLIHEVIKHYNNDDGYDTLFFFHDSGF